LNRKRKSEDVGKHASAKRTKRSEEDLAAATIVAQPTKKAENAYMTNTDTNTENTTEALVTDVPAPHTKRKRGAVKSKVS